VSTHIAYTLHCHPNILKVGIEFMLNRRADTNKDTVGTYRRGIAAELFIVGYLASAQNGGQVYNCTQRAIWVANGDLTLLVELTTSARL